MKRGPLAILQEKRDKQPAMVLALLILVWTVVLASFAILRHQRLNSSAYDLAIKSQVVWNLSQGNGFASSIEVSHYLGDHVQLIMVLLAPLLSIWADVRILLVVQALLLTLGAVPVYRISHRHLKSELLSLAFAAAFLLYPTIGFVNRFDFHPLTFTILFLLLVYDFLESDRVVWANVFLLLALLVREDVGFTVFALGLYVALVQKRRWLGLFWAVLGLSWSMTAIFVVIPFFRGAGSDTLARYGWLGGTPLEMVTTAVTQPGLVWQHIFGEPLRRSFLLKLGLPVGYLALLAPAPLLVVTPVLAYNLLSTTASQSSIYFQYISPAIPFIFVAAIQGTARLQQWLQGRMPARRVRPAIAGWLALALLAAWLLDNPFTQTIEEPYFPVYALEQVTDADAFRAARALVPPNASLATMTAYAPHMALRQELSLFVDRLRMEERPYGFPQADYYLLNLTDFRWGVNARFFHANIETAIGLYGYESVFYEKDVVLLTQASAPQASTGAVLQRIHELQEGGAKFAPAAPETIRWMGQQWLRTRLPETAVATPVRFGESIRLLGYEASGTTADPGQPMCVTLYWQADVPVTTEYTRFLHFVDETGYVHTQRDGVPAQGFYPTTAWQPQEVVADLRCMQIPPQLAPGNYGVNAGLYNPGTGERLPILQEAELPAPGAWRLLEVNVGN